MKILAIGDFHGKLPKGIPSFIKKNKVDLVLSVGDYCPFRYRELWFKHCYGKKTEIWEVIGKKKTKQLVDHDIADGKKVLEKLNALPVPVFTVLGNLDYIGYADTADFGRTAWDYPPKNTMQNLLKKYANIKEFSYSFIPYKGLLFVGAYGQTFPGRVKSKAYKKHRKKLDKLFHKFQKQNKQGKVIFVSHNVPYNTKLDKISMKAHVSARGKHYGSKLIRRIINVYQPSLYLGGHIHEGFGKTKLGKTFAINSGSAREGQMVLIDFDETKGKVRKAKFYKKWQG